MCLQLTTMFHQRVVVTGLGLVTPLGIGVSKNWSGLRTGKSGVRALTSEQFNKLPSRVAARVPDSELNHHIDLHMTTSKQRQQSRATLFSLIAAHEAWTDAGLRPGPENQEIVDSGPRSESSLDEIDSGLRLEPQTGVAFGVGMVDLNDVYNTGCLIEQGQSRRVSPYFVPRILTNMAAGAISIRFGLNGPNHAVSTACTTGAHAIGDAYNFIRLGYADILFLHGYRQNADIFRQKTGSLRKLLKKYAEFDFITASHKPNLPDEPTNNGAETSSDPRGWWFSRPEHHYKATDVSQLDTGFNESVAMVIETLDRAEPPYDGILSFSQGACLAALMLAMQEKKEIQLRGIRFCIQIASFVSGCAPHHFQSQTRISLPTLYVYGETDERVTAEMSEQLLQLYDNATVIKHPGGHFIPTPTPYKNVIVTFLEQFLVTNGENECSTK